MSLRRLQIFVEVAARGSFSQAADRLGLAPSAVSMQMHALEEELGTDLFDRSRRPPVLNDTGLDLVPAARAVLGKYDDLKTVVRGRGKLSGTLRLGVIQTASTSFLPEALTWLHEYYPGLRVQIESGLSSGLLGRVSRGDLDAAILTAPDRLPSELRVHELFTEPLCVIAPTRLPVRDGLPEGAEGSDAEILSRYPFIRFNRRTGVGRVIERGLRDRDILVDEVMELDAIEPIIGMVARGLGVSVVPEYAIAKEAAGTIRAMPFGDPPLTRDVILVERHTSSRVRLCDALLDAIIACSNVIT